MVIEAGFGPDEKENQIRPWINIEDEHGDDVIMRWPENESAKSRRAAKNFFWISIGLGVVLAAAVGLCSFGLLVWRMIVETIGGF